MPTFAPISVPCERMVPGRHVARYKRGTLHLRANGRLEWQEFALLREMPLLCVSRGIPAKFVQWGGVDAGLVQIGSVYLELSKDAAKQLTEAIQAALPRKERP